MKDFKLLIKRLLRVLIRRDHRLSRFKINEEEFLLKLEDDLERMIIIWVKECLEHLRLLKEKHRVDQIQIVKKTSLNKFI